MSSNHLKLNNPCGESWDNMTPNAKGKFCDACAKTVIDFSQLSPQQISEHLMNNKGNICARLTSTQLNTPLVFENISSAPKFPYSQVAAGVMIASALTIAQPTSGQNNTTPTHVLSTRAHDVHPQVQEQVELDKVPEQKDSVVVFQGTIVSEDGEALHNAKVTLFTLTKKVSSYTDSTGQFHLELRKKDIESVHVIRVNTSEITNKLGDFSVKYKQDFLVYKKDLQFNDEYQIGRELMYLGGIGHYVEANNPDVVIYGEEKNYYKFMREVRRKDSNYQRDKNMFFFDSKFADALLGREAELGLYVVYED